MCPGGTERKRTRPGGGATVQQRQVDTVVLSEREKWVMERGGCVPLPEWRKERGGSVLLHCPISFSCRWPGTGRIALGRGGVLVHSSLFFKRMGEERQLPCVFRYSWESEEREMRQGCDKLFFGKKNGGKVVLLLVIAPASRRG